MARQQIDTIQAKDQLQALQATLAAYGPGFFMEWLFWILQKKKNELTGAESSRLVPFKLNLIQRSVEEDLAQNNLFGKPRQSGFTTYLSLRRGLLPVITDGGVGAILISQSSEYAAEHFAIARRAYRLIGAEDPFDDSKNEFSKQLKANLLHTAYSNRRELVFDYLDSKFRIATAGVEEAGQGLTLHHIIADEYARWPGKPEATLANVRGALVPGGTVDKLSTANGAGGSFYEDVIRAMQTPEDSDARLFYYSWWWDEGYLNTDMTPKELAMLEADLQADEIRIIAKMHSELKTVKSARAA